jgi:hypothetical protein
MNGIIAEMPINSITENTKDIINTNINNNFSLFESKKRSCLTIFCKEKGGGGILNNEGTKKNLLIDIFN